MDNFDFIFDNFTETDFKKVNALLNIINMDLG